MDWPIAQKKEKAHILAQYKVPFKPQRDHHIFSKSAPTHNFVFCYIVRASFHAFFSPVTGKMTSNAGNVTPLKKCQYDAPQSAHSFLSRILLLSLFVQTHVPWYPRKLLKPKFFLLKNNKSWYLITQQDSEILLFLECLSFQLNSKNEIVFFFFFFIPLQEGQSQLFATVNRNIDTYCGYITWQWDEKI